MKVSLVLATLNRPKELAKFLEYYVMQDYSNTELVIVDQSSNDFYKENKNSLSKYEHNINVIHIKLEEKGLSRARNIGLKYVSGDIVGFPDDDCWYPCGFISSVVDKFIKNEKLRFISGYYREEELDNANKPDHDIHIRNIKDCSKANSVTLFIKDNIKNIYFDQRIGAGTDMPIGEEKELMYRLLFEGNLGKVYADLYCYHKIDRSNTLDKRVIYSRYRGQSYILAKHINIHSCKKQLFFSIVKNVLLFNFYYVKGIVLGARFGIYKNL